MTERLSAATVRNVMQDLEHLGLLDSPHISAGRIPTQQGLRLFVDSLLEVGSVASEDREIMDAALSTGEKDVTTLLDQVSTTLSAITNGASLVLSPKQDAVIKHIEFVSLAPDRALVVLVFANGHVENRMIVPPTGQTPSSMREAEPWPSCGSTSVKKSPNAVRRLIRSPASWSKAVLPSGSPKTTNPIGSLCAAARISSAIRMKSMTSNAFAASSMTWNASVTSPNS
jgi:hypothetical protein